MLRPSTVITSTYVYTRDVLFHILEAIIRILRLNRLLPIGDSSSPKDRIQADDDKEEEKETTWTMTVEPYNPRDFSSPSKRELPKTTSGVKDEGTVSIADAGGYQPTQVDKLGGVVTSEQPEHRETAQITPVYHIRASSAFTDVNGETPEVFEYKPNTLERADSYRDVLVDDKGPDLAVAESLPSGSEKPDLEPVAPVSKATDDERKPESVKRTDSYRDVLTGDKVPNLAVTESLSSVGDQDLDQVSSVSNLMDDEGKPNAEEQTESYRDAVVGGEVPYFAATESLSSSSSDDQNMDRLPVVMNAADVEYKPAAIERKGSYRDVVVGDKAPSTDPFAGAKSPSAELTKNISSGSGDVDLDRVSNLSNATDDTEDDRMRALSQVDPTYSGDEHERGRDKSYSMEDKLMTRALARRERVSSRGARSEAEIARSKLDGWSSSSGEEDEEEYTLPMQSPRFMPTMTQASFLSL